VRFHDRARIGGSLVLGDARGQLTAWLALSGAPSWRVFGEIARSRDLEGWPLPLLLRLPHPEMTCRETRGPICFETLPPPGSMRSAGSHAAGFASFPGVAGLGLREKQVLRFAQDDKCFFCAVSRRGGRKPMPRPVPPRCAVRSEATKPRVGVGGNLASAARYFCARF